MAVGTIRVRNACPFPVTFYAIAGPSIELGAYQTKSADACLIWFSTRVKGPGNAINKGIFEAHRQEYESLLYGLGSSSLDWKEGGTGAAAGSLLGIAVGWLEQIFKVQNTASDKILYFGDKEEGVYGNSNLVVYATLDPANKLNDGSIPNKWWILHLEKDRGQMTGRTDSPPVHQAMDRSRFDDTLFFRAKNQALGRYLAADPGGNGAGLQADGGPFAPLEQPTYWTLIPKDTDTHDIKILNVKTQELLAVPSTQTNQVVLDSLGEPGIRTQHWDVQVISTNPKTVLLENVAAQGYLSGTSANGLAVHPPAASDPHLRWLIETFTTQAESIDTNHAVRLMHSQTGKYITLAPRSGEQASLETTADANQWFVLERASNGDYRLKNVKYKTYLAFLTNERFLTGIEPDQTDAQAQSWSVRLISKTTGFQLHNTWPGFGESNHLSFVNGVFGLSGGNSPEQLWVLQLEAEV